MAVDNFLTYLSVDYWLETDQIRYMLVLYPGELYDCLSFSLVLDLTAEKKKEINKKFIE